VVCALRFNTIAAAAAATEFANFATQKLCCREQEDLGQQPSSSFTMKAAAHSGSVTLCTLAAAAAASSRRVQKSFPTRQDLVLAIKPKAHITRHSNLEVL
jgi:hypothetical protein